MPIRGICLLLTFFVSVYLVKCGDNGLKEQMEKEKIVPNIIDTVPGEIVEVIYPSGVKVDAGNKLTPTQVKDEPAIKWSADDDGFYTLLMIDPDAPSRIEPTLGEILHWFVGNIPGKDVKNGDTFAEYRGSGPPLGTGFHRYIFLVYKQSGKIEFNEKKIDRLSREGRIKFSTRKFAEKYSLGQPIAGNFYQAEYDDWVPVMQKMT